MSERDIALKTYRQTRAVKWILAVALGLVLLVVAFSVVLDYRQEQQLRQTCAEGEELLAQYEDSPLQDNPDLLAFKRMQRRLC